MRVYIYYIRNWATKEYLSAENKEKEGYIYTDTNRGKREIVYYSINKNI